jgi:hypothetical protein
MNLENKKKIIKKYFIFAGTTFSKSKFSSTCAVYCVKLFKPRRVVLLFTLQNFNKVESCEAPRLNPLAKNQPPRLEKNPAENDPPEANPTLNKAASLRARLLALRGK